MLTRTLKSWTWPWAGWLRRRKPASVIKPALAETAPSFASAKQAGESKLEDVVEEMFDFGRYALLLRPQIASSLTDDQRARALVALEQAMAITPAGEVVVGPIDPALDDGRLSAEELEDFRAQVIDVDAFYLDRYPVTNRQFQQFVASGGYEQMTIWEQEAWPAILDLVDQTGHSGPRFWKNGRYERGQDDHPVVGVCWYEAAAYARWVGKRLATDAEWVKAGSWPVKVGDAHLQRKYPWGDTMDRNRANLWGAGTGSLAPVTAFAGGVSVGGAYQLIGNTWEWTTDEFQPQDGSIVRVEGGAFGSALKSLRGGAYDTYFDAQATCQFQSGDHALARKHNIGFRCALSICDLARPEQACGEHEHEMSLAEAAV
jgi:gamma-glutamyl hercynylcysteine S-oxide synthase